MTKAVDYVNISIYKGEYHAEYMDVGIWQLERIEKSHDICGSYITYKADDVRIVNEEIVSNYISPQVVSFEDLEKVHHLYAGHMPQDEDEIVMDKWVMETLGLGTEPGAKIRLSLNTADKDTKEVYQIERDFQIVGILGDIESLRAGNISYVIFDKGFLDRISKKISYNVKIRLKSNFESRKQVEDLAYTYIFRYKRKLVFNILSVTSTFILFIVAGSIIGSISLDSLANLTIGGDYSIQISDTVSRGRERVDLLNADFLNELNNYEEIERYHTVMYNRIWWAERSAKNHIELPKEYIELGIGYGEIASILYASQG